MNEKIKSVIKILISKCDYIDISYSYEENLSIEIYLGNEIYIYKEDYENIDISILENFKNDIVKIIEGNY